MHLFIFIIATCIVISDAFFFFGSKDRWLFCFKICPLYCSPRRYDEDAAASIYVDEKLPYYPPYPSYPSFPSYADTHGTYPRSHYGFVICKPETTTTTPKPTTTTMPSTTPEPSYLCMMCMRKCNDLDRK